MSDFQFWLVWNPAGRNPVVEHVSPESATREAERLASLNPGAQFFVLQAVELRRTSITPMERITLPPRPPQADDDIPF